MKASELVKKLNELIAEHGDLEVGYYCGEYGWTLTDDPDHEIPSWGYPERFTL